MTRASSRSWQRARLQCRLRESFSRIIHHYDHHPLLPVAIAIALDLFSAASCDCWRCDCRDTAAFLCSQAVAGAIDPVLILQKKNLAAREPFSDRQSTRTLSFESDSKHSSPSAIRL